jgi:hypothetical protein
VGRGGGEDASIRRLSAPPPHRLAKCLLPLPLIAFATFVAVYPYLWRDPIGHTFNLIEFRADEMATQARNWPNVAVESRAEAFRRIGVTLGDRFSTTGRLASKLAHGFGREWHPAGTDLPFAIVGGEILIALAIWRGLSSRWTLAGLVLGTQAALIVAGMRSDWARYHLPVLMVAAVCVGVLAGQLWTLLSRPVVLARSRAVIYGGIDRLMPDGAHQAAPASAAPGTTRRSNPRHQFAPRQPIRGSAGTRRVSMD